MEVMIRVRKFAKTVPPLSSYSSISYSFSTDYCCLNKERIPLQSQLTLIPIPTGLRAFPGRSTLAVV
jgi:hypothetical protein